MTKNNQLSRVAEIVRSGNIASSLPTENCTLANAAREISCNCVQCDDRDWPGIAAEFMDLIEAGSDAFLDYLQTEWRVWKENRQLAYRPIWTAEELLVIDDRVRRAQIAASEGVDIFCERTRFILRDLADEGFWGKAAFDRLTSNVAPEKPHEIRRRHKHPKSGVGFDLFGDFGIDVATENLAISAGGELDPFGHPKGAVTLRPVHKSEPMVADDFGQSVLDELWKQRNTSLKHWPRELFEKLPSDNVLNAKPQDNPFLKKAATAESSQS